MSFKCVRRQQARELEIFLYLAKINSHCGYRKTSLILLSMILIKFYFFFRGKSFKNKWRMIKFIMIFCDRTTNHSLSRDIISKSRVSLTQYKTLLWKIFILIYFGNPNLRTYSVAYTICTVNDVFFKFLQPKLNG